MYLSPKIEIPEAARRIPTPFLIAASLFLFIASAFAADAKPVKPVLIFLVNHGFMLDAPQKRVSLSNQLIQEMSGKLETAGVPKERPVALWVESSVPARLAFSLVEPERFYDKLSKESGFEPYEISELLMNPEWGKDERSQKLRGVLEAIYKGDKKKAPAAAKSVIKAGEQHLEKEMPKDVMGQKLGEWAEKSEKYNFAGYKVEKAPFDSWIENLRAKQWEYASYEAFQKRHIEKALKLALYENIHRKKSMVLRDKKLAKDIAKWHKNHPNMVNVVLRGASHEYLAPQLKKLGLDSDVSRQAEMAEALCVAEIYGSYQPSKDVYEEGYLLNALERRVMAGAFLERLCWFHMVEGLHKEFGLETSKKLTQAIRSLPDKKLQQWLDMMTREPAELPLEKDASLSWSWLSKAVDLKDIV